MLSQDTLLDLKFGGYHQRQTETPDGGDTPARYDGFEDRLSENWWGPFNANRERYQLLASVSHFTDDFIRGEHDFKFGVELQNTLVNTLNGLSGGRYYYDFAGENYILYESTGYNTFADTDKIVGYVQDSWGINDRVRLNLGLRANYWRGSLESDVNGVRFDQGTVFTPDLALAPRIGLNINLGDDNDSVLKAHWGRYYHQVISLFYSRLAPESDWTGYIWNADDEVWEHDFTEARGPGQWTIDDGLGVPYMDALDVGWEKVLTRTVSLDITATYPHEPRLPGRREPHRRVRAHAVHRSEQRPHLQRLQPDERGREPVLLHERQLLPGLRTGLQGAHLLQEFPQVRRDHGEHRQAMAQQLANAGFRGPSARQGATTTTAGTSSRRGEGPRSAVRPSSRTRMFRSTPTAT